MVAVEEEASRGNKEMREAEEVSGEEEEDLVDVVVVASVVVTLVEATSVVAGGISQWCGCKRSQVLLTSCHQ